MSEDTKSERSYSQVYCAVRKISSVTDQLEELVARLSDKLSPVILQNAPEPSDTDVRKAVAGEPEKSELARELHTYADQLEEKCERIKSLLIHIDI